ncbi:MAG: hypothetical protein HDR43_01180, partial [Mycoplasma sp.]|nr:hypothetical protein [Mycoplasma sp.]
MPKIDKKKAKIRQALYAGGFLLVSGICITSVSLSSILSKNRNYSNASFYFDDNVFSSYGDLENYVQSNYFVENLNVENRDKWSITKNGKTFYYNDPALLRKNVANEIKKINGKTSLPNI